MIRERDEKGRLLPAKITGECPSCGGPARFNGMCQKHYKNWWQSQDKEKRKQQGRAQYLKNKEKMNASSRSWAKANPEKTKAAERKWRKANPEKAKAAKLAWEKANPQKVRAMELARNARRDKVAIRARVAAWQKANPDRFKTQMASLRARRRGAEGKFSGKELAELFEKQKGCCAVCKIPLPKRYHKDHIKPLARGGSNYICNIQLLCQPCNSSKHARDPIEFMQSRGFLL